MAEENCRNIIAGWTVGANGECIYEEFGFRIGKTGFKKIMMQVSVCKRANNESLKVS